MSTQVETALESERTTHLGYEKHERAGEAGAPNATGEKTLARSRAGTAHGCRISRPP